MIKKEDFESLESEVEALVEKNEQLEGEIHELTEWRKGVEIGMQQLWEQWGL